MISVRCFTCNNLIAHKYGTYLEESAKKSRRDALDELEIHRLCCRRMFISHVDFFSDLIKYGNVDSIIDSTSEMRMYVKESRNVLTD